MYNDQIQGIDISGWQTRIDWNKAAEIPNLRFVYTKATQGVNTVDKMFKSHRAGGIMAQKDVGCTHFLDFHNYTRGQEIDFGRRQADFFRNVVGDNPGQAPYLVDAETNEGAAGWEKLSIWNIGRVLKIDLAFHLQMKDMGYRFGGDYVLAWVAEHMQNFMEGFGFIPRYKLVQAQRETILFNGEVVAAGKMYQPEIRSFLTAAQLSSYPQPGRGVYPKVTIWQYSSRLIGTLLGFTGYIDADIFNGTEEDYSIWLGDHSVPTKPVMEEDAPVPVWNPEGKHAQVVSMVNVRNGVGTIAGQYMVNGMKWMLTKDEPELDVLESTFDSDGNPWLRIGPHVWVCANFRGTKLVELA